MPSADPSEERFRILDKVPVGVLVLDPGYRILFWNECLENWTGVARADLLGADARSRFPNICRQGVASRIERVFRDGVPTVFSPQLHAPLIQCEVAPGVLRVQYITVTSIRRTNEPGFLAVFSIQDITDLTRRLDESRRTASELADELQRRTRLEADLRRAKEEADGANRAKSDFLANMSHEIRTPMNGVLGMIGLLLQGKLDARQRRRAETIQASSQELLALLNDILDLSKIEARRLELEHANFNLREVVESVAELVAVTAQPKGLEVLCFIEPDVPTLLRGDPSRLRQVLVNLAGNAVKFTHKGEVSIRVSATEKDGVIRFEVRDTGIGIPADKAHLLFRPFSQADASTTRRYGGSGLGLSIVSRLVEMMGGKAGFESAEGVGSRFWFTATLERQPVLRPRALNLAGRRVLAVDGNASSRNLLLELLEFWQAEGAPAGDVETAMTRLSDGSAPDGDPRITGWAGDIAARGPRQPHAFDAVVVDLEAPEGGARRLALAIEADAHLAGIPVLVMTPLHSEMDRDRWQGAGFTGRITKPIRQDELGAALAHALGFGSPPRASDRKADICKPCQASRAAVRILLAEDNPTNQEVALGILETLGYSADLVGDGRAALAALASKDYYLVLMDCQLPELDGYEACRLIRQTTTPVRNHGIPVIAMTAHALESDWARCLAAGMNDYVSKPVNPAALEQAIERWTSGMGEAEATPQDSTPHSSESTGASAEPPVFDEEDLLMRLSGNRNLAMRVVGRFLNDAPAQITTLADAVERKDCESGRRAAHAIKGAAANVGGTQLRETAYELEQLGAAGDLAAAAGLVSELAARFDTLRPVMDSFRRRVELED